MSETKICIRCNQELPATNEYYAIGKSNKGGLRCICKRCQCDDEKKRRLLKPETIAEQKKQYYENNKARISERTKPYAKQYRVDHADKIKEYNKQHSEKTFNYNKWYYANNKEILLEKQRQYNKDNSEKKSAYQKQRYINKKPQIQEYRASHKEQHALNEQNRRAAKRELPSTLTLDQWEECKEYFNQKCAYCGAEEKLTQDHYIPVTKGGEYTCKNIIPSCGSCNSRKRVSLPNEWYPKQQFYSKKRERKIISYLTKNYTADQISMELSYAN